MCLKKNNREIVYSFFKIQSTDEVHIFKSYDLENCVVNEYAICKKVSRISQDVKNMGSCITENGVRIKAALIGRTVCGICVSHLYETYE